MNYTHNGLPGKVRLALSYGFFTRTVDEQIFLLNCVLGSADYREMVPRTLSFPLDERKIADACNRHLRIGYFADDGFMKPVPG